jgi:hypothetical protein
MITELVRFADPMAAGLPMVAADAVAGDQRAAVGEGAGRAGADPIDAAMQAGGVARAAKPQIGFEIDAVAVAMAQAGPAMPLAGILDVSDVARAAVFEVNAGTAGLADVRAGPADAADARRAIEIAARADALVVATTEPPRRAARRFLQRATPPHGQRAVRSEQRGDRGQHGAGQGAEHAPPRPPRDEALDDAVEVQAVHVIPLHGTSDDAGAKYCPGRKRMCEFSLRESSQL